MLRPQTQPAKRARARRQGRIRPAGAKTIANAEHRNTPDETRWWRAPHAERNYQRASRARGGRQNNSQPPYATRVARWARAPRALKHAPDSQIALGRAHRSQREAIIGRVGPCSERQATSAPVRHAKKRACMGSAFGQRLALSARRSVASRWARRYASPPLWSNAHPRPGRKPGQGLPTNKRPVAPRAAPRA